MDLAEVDGTGVWGHGHSEGPFLLEKAGGVSGELSRRRPLIFNLSLHPYLIGHPHRLKPFRRFLEHLADHRTAIWLTRPGAIADHAEALFQAGHA